MARIAQQRFPWEEIEALGDLERLQLLLVRSPVDLSTQSDSVRPPSPITAVHSIR
jgi:hypothetical protein